MVFSEVERVLEVSSTSLMNKKEIELNQKHNLHIYEQRNTARFLKNIFLFIFLFIVSLSLQTWIANGESLPDISMPEKAFLTGVPLIHFEEFTYLLVDEQEIWKADGSFEGTIHILTIPDDQKFGGALRFGEKIQISTVDRHSSWLESLSPTPSVYTHDPRSNEITGPVIFPHYPLNRYVNNYGVEPFAYKDKAWGNSSISQSVANLEYKGRLIYLHNNGLWWTDGTISGTEQITEVSGAKSFIAYNGLFYFLVENVIWRSDGTSEGTYSIANGERVETSITCYERGPRLLNGKLYFVSGSNLCQKVRIDQSEAITIDQDVYGSFLSMSDKMIHVKDCDLWGTDLEGNDIQLVDVDPEHISGNFYPCNFLLNGTENLVFFKQITVNKDTDGGPYEWFTSLWVTDGTVSGTKKLRKMRTDGECESCFPEGKIYMDRLYHWPQFISDGTVDGTLTQEELHSDLSGMQIVNVTTFNQDVYFNVSSNYADPSDSNIWARQNSAVLWRTNGTKEGTYPIATIQDEGVINFWRNTKDQMILKVTYEDHFSEGHWGHKVRFYRSPVVAISDGTTTGTNFINKHDFSMTPQIYLPVLASNH